MAIFVSTSMMYLKRRINSIFRLVLAAVFLLPLSLLAQNEYPGDYFRSPVDFRILLSGTFGELRGGHFHSGMDIKTGGVQGKNIYAVAEGYVSRIKVSATGFGKTLYITHPNGYVSVYAHLSRFNKTIAKFVKAKHYEKESFEMDLYPGKGQFKVKKGEVIAYSGNSGGSNGPHLHFEMRLEKTQTPVNPLLFGFEVKDYIRPEINWLKVIPVGPGSTVDGQPGPKVFRVDGWGEKHRVQDHDTIRVCGPFALAVNTFDKLNDASNKNGVYAVELFADGRLQYSHDLEKFDFSETRYINSFIDYAEYVENKRRYQRTEIDPNNKLSIYREVLNRGVLYFDDDSLHHLEYVIRDFAGNISRLPIIIRTSPFTDPAGMPPPEGARYFGTEGVNSFDAEGISLSLPGECLYRETWFACESRPRPRDAYARVHIVHDEHVPLHRYFSLTITPDSLPAETDKLFIARISDEGEYIYSGGEWENGSLRASVRSFGEYTIVADSIPPVIKSVNIASGRIKKDRETVKVKISDERSGIAKYRGTLNGSWVLMEYDPKRNLLIYEIDQRLRKGENSFRVEVEDGLGNKAVFIKTLIRE